MIHWLWLIPAFLVGGMCGVVIGGVFGVVLTCLCVAKGRNERV